MVHQTHRYSINLEKATELRTRDNGYYAVLRLFSIVFKLSNKYHSVGK